MQAELPCSSVVLWVPMSTPNGTSCNIIGLFMLIVSATCHSCWQNGSPTIILSRDTDFCAEKGVSRHKRQPNDRKTVRDTRFHTEKGVSLQGNTAQRPKLSQPYSRYRFLCGKRVCRGTKSSPMTGKPSAIHGFMPKRVYRCKGTRLSCPNRPNPARDTDF